MSHLVPSPLSRGSYVPPYYMARAYAVMNDGESAFAWLEKAFEIRDPQLVFLKIDLTFDSLRSDPRFEDLLRRIGFPP